MMQTLSLNADLQSGRFELVINWPTNPERWLASKYRAWRRKRLLHRLTLDLDDHLLRDVGLYQAGYRSRRKDLYRCEIRHRLL